MTAASVEPAKKAGNEDNAEVIPVTDVPAFGVQLRFAKRALAALLGRDHNGSSATNGSTPRA